MEKSTVGKIMGAIVIILFAAFWLSTFSVRTLYDGLFFAGYAVVLTTFILLFRKSQKSTIYISLAIGLCIVTLASLIAYKAWNEKGFYIDADSVEMILYRENETQYVIGDDEESIESIIKKLNKAYCVKNWENQGELGIHKNRCKHHAYSDFYYNFIMPLFLISMREMVINRHCYVLKLESPQQLYSR